MDFVGETQGAVGIEPELILGIGQDQGPLGGERLAAGEQGKGGFAHLPPLCFTQQPTRKNLVRGQGFIMGAVGGLAGGRDDRGGKRLVVGEAIGQ